MVMMIVLYHGYGGIYTSLLMRLPFFSALLGSATTAVGYMYVLSGFVMSLVYYRPLEKFDIVAYWKARFVRIYPLYLIAFLLICYYYLDAILNIKPQKILANLFVIQAWIPAYSQSFNYPAWSVTVELFFYFIFPFFILWAYRQPVKKLIWAALGFWAVSQVVYQVLWIGYIDTQRTFILYFPLFHLNSFIMGAVGGIWYLREGRQRQLNPALILSVLTASFLLLVGYLIVSMSFLPALPHGSQPMAGLLAPLMILFIVSLAMDESRVSKFLNHPWLVNLGETSYAIYILHVPVIWLFERYVFDSSFSNPERVFAMSAAPLIIVVGLLMYFFVDTPLRKWLKNTLPHINIPLFLLDLTVVPTSVFLSFHLRFGEGREYDSYLVLIRLLFWSAFFLRAALSIVFRTFDPGVLRLPLFQVTRSVFISTMLGSLVLTAIGYVGFYAGLYENFPRSVLVMDWLIVFSASMFVRMLFRVWLAKYSSLVPQL
jgi:peptidoglycan/LPS O-acetylase OafA/YrhL